MITLHPLPYSFDALEPVIDAKTVEIHYTKHHQGYANKLNDLIKGTEYESMDLETMISKVPQGPLFNNAAQIWNHSFYRNCLRPQQANNQAQGIVLDAIVAKRGSFESFKETFSNSAIGNFGSGWTWLVKNTDGNLEIVNTSNAQTPLTGDQKPLLTIDVREHAYYLNYQNRRPDYINSLRDCIDWDKVSKRFA